MKIPFTSVGRTIVLTVPALHQVFAGASVRGHRQRIARYLAEDREMCGVMGRAVAQLSAVSRQRLQALYDQTIQAALAEPGASATP